MKARLKGKGYSDGNAVRTLEPVELKTNQLVTINIPEPVKTKDERAFGIAFTKELKDIEPTSFTDADFILL